MKSRCLVSIVFFLVISNHGLAQLSLQDQEYVELRAEHTSFAQAVAQFDRQFSGRTNRNWTTLSRSEDSWIRVAASWTLLKREATRTVEDKHSEILAQFNGFVQGTFYDYPVPEVWTDALLNLQMTDEGGVLLGEELPAVDQSDLRTHAGKEKWIEATAPTGFEDGVIVCLDADREVVWSASVWATNGDSTLNANASVHHYLCLRTNAAQTSVMLFGITSNCCCITSRCIESGKLEGYCFLRFGSAFR